VQFTLGGPLLQREATSGLNGGWLSASRARCRRNRFWKWPDEAVFQVDYLDQVPSVKSVVLAKGEFGEKIKLLVPMGHARAGCGRSAQFAKPHFAEAQQADCPIEAILLERAVKTPDLAESILKRRRKHCYLNGAILKRKNDQKKVRVKWRKGFRFKRAAYGPYRQADLRMPRRQLSSKPKSKSTTLN